MTATGGIAGDRLRSFIERIERLEEEKAEIASQIKEVFAEAKSNGFNTKIMKNMIKLRTLEETEREEGESLRDLYMRALGMLPEPAEEDPRQPRLRLAPSAPSGETTH